MKVKELWLGQNSHGSLTIIRVESENRPNNELAGRAEPTIRPVRLAEALGSAVQSSDLVDITISFRRRANEASGQPASSSTTDALQQIAALLEDLDADQRAAGNPTHLAASPGAENQGLKPIEEDSKISGLKGKVTYSSVIATLGLLGQFGGYNLHNALAAGERPSSPNTKPIFKVPESKPPKISDISVPWDHLNTRDLGPIKLFVNGSELKWGDEGKHSDADEEASASRAARDGPDQGQPSALPPDIKVKAILPDGTEIAADVPMGPLSNR